MAESTDEPTSSEPTWEETPYYFSPEWAYLGFCNDDVQCRGHRIGPPMPLGECVDRGGKSWEPLLGGECVDL